MNDKLLALLEQFPEHEVAVIGDLVADQFIYGEAKRVSREAPVLIVEHEADKIALGGGANCAHNVLALGGHPLVVGIIGDDLQGAQLLETLQERGIGTDFILRDPSRDTTTKQRIVASGLHTTYQQLVRVDRGSRVPVSGDVEKKLLDLADQTAGMSDIMVASDYGYGVFSESMITRMSAIAESDWIKVLVDSRYRALQFKGAHLLTPNEPEAGAACHMEIRTRQDVELVAERLLHGANAERVVITRGREGMYVRDANKGGEFIPIYGTDQIADVTGAGDTVMAVFALAAACKADLGVAVRLATVAAGLAVLKHGTATVTVDEIRTALEKHPWQE
ncbi:MAG: bifunctional ADP-heptose synthase [Candidatus Lernaella stagnicola]|nr:bifunctional ADP-heptose synthase [Candidatus Lernaella stagnicola]